MMRLLPPVLVVLLAVGPLAADQRGSRSAPTARGEFSLGVLRRDGLVIPFAAFDGRRWRASWPVDLRFVELPISIDSIDRDWWGGVAPPEAMTLWSDGRPGAELSLRAPAFVRYRCAQRLGLTTNYHPAVTPPSPAEQPFPKDGLLVSGSQSVDAIATVTGDRAEAEMVREAILREFNDEENFAATSFAQWRHPVPKNKRRDRPIEIEALYRAPMDEPGWTAYYVEATRSYDPGPEDEGCGLLTSARGWLRTGPNGKRQATLGAEVTYCDRYGVSFMLPLGLVRAGGSTYWVYQLAGYENEAYLIARPTPRSVDRVIAYPAMSCSRFF